MSTIFLRPQPVKKVFGRRSTIDREQEAIIALRAAIAANDVTAIAAARRQLDRIMD